MKKLIFAVTVIFALSALAPNSGIAEPTHPNEVGLYMNEDGTGATGTYVVGTPVTVYLVLTKPADDQNNFEPYPSVRGFECVLIFDPIPNNDLLLLSYNWPTPAVDIGWEKDINAGYIDVVVGFSTQVPVTDESVMLVGLEFLNFNASTIEVSLSPLLDDHKQSIKGQMAFEGLQGHLSVMYSVAGSHDAPVFIFNGEAVAVENESFGSVKALYR